MEKHIHLEVNGEDLDFTVTPEAYTKYVNEFQPTSKVAPSHALVMRTVDDNSRDAAKELLKQPGLALHLAGALVEEYSPDVTIVVGKSKASPSA